MSGFLSQSRFPVMKRVRDLLPEVYRRSARGSEAEQEIALSYWAAAVGRKLARRTKPVRLDGDKLVVDVDGPILQEQLRILSRQIIGRLNASIGAELVRRIVFRVAAPGKISPQRDHATLGSAGAGDEAQAIEDPLLRRLYRHSRNKARRRTGT